MSEGFAGRPFRSGPEIIGSPFDASSGMVAKFTHDKRWNKRARSGLYQWVLAALTQPEKMGITKTLSSMLQDQMAARMSQARTDLGMRLSRYSGAYNRALMATRIGLSQEAADARRKFLADLQGMAVRAGTAMDTAWQGRKGRILSARYMSRKRGGGLLGGLGGLASTAASLGQAYYYFMSA